MTTAYANKGQVVTERQLEDIARRLFDTLDISGVGALAKPECFEFFEFCKSHLLHDSFKTEDQEQKYEAKYEQLKPERIQIKVDAAE